jgi:glycosyltransferase involved in cell wall biosynthesis
MMPTKILYLSHVSKMGGAEENLFSLVKSLDRKRYTPVVICQEDGELPQRLREVGVEVSYLKMRGWRKAKYFLVNLVTVIRLFRFIKRNNINLVHINPYRLAPYGVLAAKLAKIPSVLSIHDFLDKDKIKRFLVNYADTIIVVSDIIGEVFKDYKKDVITVYNGIDFSIFDRATIKANEVKKELVKDGNYLVGMIGQIAPWKGQEDFLKSAAEVLKKEQAVKFLIVGDAIFNNEFSIEKLKEISAQYGIGSRVIFTGWRNDIPQIIACLDILILPSWKEPFGRVMLEAMAMVRPVIATDCGGPGELITNNETGILVPVKRPELLAEAIIKLLKSPQQRKILAEAGYNLARERFDLKNQVRQVENLYSEILERKQ